MSGGLGRDKDLHRLQQFAPTSIVSATLATDGYAIATTNVMAVRFTKATTFFLNSATAASSTRATGEVFWCHHSLATLTVIRPAQQIEIQS
jgi:hypothetical protein